MSRLKDKVTVYHRFYVAPLVVLLFLLSVLGAFFMISRDQQKNLEGVSGEYIEASRRINDVFLGFMRAHSGLVRILVEDIDKLDEEVVYEQGIVLIDEIEYLGESLSAMGTLSALFPEGVEKSEVSHLVFEGSQQFGKYLSSVRRAIKISTVNKTLSHEYLVAAIKTHEETSAKLDAIRNGLLARVAALNERQFKEERRAFYALWMILALLVVGLLCFSHVMAAGMAKKLVGVLATLKLYASEKERDAPGGPLTGAGDELARIEEAVRVFGRTVRELREARSQAEEQNVLLRGEVELRKKTESSLLLARNLAEQASQAKSEFLSSMSHELRTPLNSIMGFAQILKDYESLSDEQQEFVANIYASSERLLSMVQGVLRLNQIEAGSVSLDIVPVDAAGLLEDCLREVSKIAAENEIRIVNKLADETPPPVLADMAALQEVFLNLLTNAIVYNRSGGQVSVSWRPVGYAHIRLSIADTGMGIAKDLQSHMFEPFNRLGHEGGAISGTGIGLVTAKKLVKLMEGEIDFSSIEGEGSTFWVDLPRAGDA